MLAWTPNSKCNEKKPKKNWTKFAWFWENVITKYWQHIFFFLSNSKSYLGDFLCFQMRKQRTKFMKETYVSEYQHWQNQWPWVTYALNSITFMVSLLLFRLLEPNCNPYVIFLRLQQSDAHQHRSFQAKKNGEVMKRIEILYWRDKRLN